MKHGKKRKEKMYNKLTSVANLLIDDIIVPFEEDQSGSKEITVGWYDRHGNRFDLTSSLVVKSASAIALEKLAQAEKDVEEEIENSTGNNTGDNTVSPTDTTPSTDTGNNTGDVDPNSPDITNNPIIDGASDNGSP